VGGGAGGNAKSGVAPKPAVRIAPAAWAAPAGKRQRAATPAE